MKKIMVILCVIVLTLGVNMATVFASDDLGALTGETGASETAQASTTDQQTAGTAGTDNSGSALSGYMGTYNPISDDNMKAANHVASPIVNFIGTMIGFIMLIVTAGIVLVTALDLAYIGLPFTRDFLNPQAAGGATGGMSGMGGGFGGGYGGGFGGGYGGMNSGMNAAQPQSQGLMKRRWVSDEAVACVQTATPAPAGGMGMGMGIGGFGGGMMGAQQPQPQAKSVIVEYFKKRSVFIVIFTVAAIILTSSILTKSGINLASLLFKVLEKVNGSVANTNV